jgi:hydroxymethylpyrimidine/phosphomethylpyrimidine kinase
MSLIHPNVISIAGFDPSGGAGILADIKTFESNLAYGFGICSAITLQNDIDFIDLKWIDTKTIINQINILHNRFDFEFVKIGLIENIDVLETVINKLLSFNKDTKIIWDPILKASAGFIFHKNLSENKLLDLLRKIYLITPNFDEAKEIFCDTEPKQITELIKAENICSILVKGGHNKDNTANDILYEKDEITVFKGKQLNKNNKHGTGCVLSSAITANLANGYNLKGACKNAKKYVRNFMLSNNTYLGYHIKHP